MAEFSIRQPFLNNLWLFSSTSQASGTKALLGSQILRTWALWCLLTGPCYQASVNKWHSGKNLFCSVKASFFQPPPYLSPTSAPNESEWQRPRTTLWLSLNLLFLLTVLERVIPLDERNLREMLPSSGKHAKERPQRIGISSHVYNCPHCGWNAQLCVLVITKKGYSMGNYMEAEGIWIKFTIQ